MLWVYVILLTAGVVAVVPTLIRAVDGLPSDTLTGAIGFGGLFSGATGLTLRFADLNSAATFVVAIAVGVGAAALHTELIDRLRPDVDPSNLGLPELAGDTDEGGFRVDKPQSTRGAS